MLKHVNNKNFKEEVLKSDRVVLVDFFATWCPPCKMLSPVLEKISNSRTEFDIAKINIDDDQDLAREYKIEAVPTMLVFKNGKKVDELMGFSEENKILDLMAKYI